MIEVKNNPKYKRVYLSGPITGLPNGNKEAFQAYEDRFVNMQFEVVNPHKLHTEEQEKTFEWSDFMKSDIKALLDCQVVAMMPGWEKSKGANIEIYIARNLNIPVINADTLNEVF